MPDFKTHAVPPLQELTRERYRDCLAKDFSRQALKPIADDPGSYSDFVSEKARHAMSLSYAARLALLAPDRTARYYGYKLGANTVGTMQTVQKRGALHINYLITHPGVENAGDILLQHAIGQAGKTPRLTLCADNQAAAFRYRQLGFSGPPGRMRLDPARSRGQWAMADDHWIRAARRGDFLVAEDAGEPVIPCATMPVSG